MQQTARAMHVALGAAAFIGAHLTERLAWREWFDPAGQYAAWFLNSGRAVAVTAAFVFLGAVLATAFYRSNRQAAITGGGLVAGGAVAAMIVVLFMTGPGTLFPIAIVIGAIVVAASAVGGALTAWLARTTTDRV